MRQRSALTAKIRRDKKKIMNNNSVICNFISEHPSDWEVLLTEQYCVKVRREGALAIFNYERDCDFADPVVQEARGIIIDVEKLEVVCWPFRKFGNYNEGYVDDIDWNSARVLEKVDGSIVKLWYDGANGKWQFSTNGVIRAENAPVDGTEGITYANIIRSADNFKDIPLDRLNEQFTYIFELVSPQTRVVISYPYPSLYHLGTRDNKSGAEHDEDIGIKKPSSYSIRSLKDCIDAAIALNKGVNESQEVTGEGFVVVDKNWHRIKVKSPDYLMMHHIASQDFMTKKEFIQMLISDRERIDFICRNCPKIVPVLRFYDYHLAELSSVADRIADLARSLYSEYDGDRAAVAKILLKHRLSSVAFKSLSCNKRGSEILVASPMSFLCKVIPDYKVEDLSCLFEIDE